MDRRSPPRMNGFVLALFVAGWAACSGCGVPATSSSLAVDEQSQADESTPEVAPPAKTEPVEAQPQPSDPEDSTGPDEPAADEGPPNPFPRRIRSPSLEGGVGWINTAGPLDIADLKGKFVLLDFWTYCCINCIHVLPELKKLEQAYPNELVVVGVHSAKFDGEKDSQNITDAVLRYEIEHPVVNDANHVIWDRFGVSSWPTMILIDPEGYAVFYKPGESKFAMLDEILKAGVAYYKKRGTLDDTPLRFDLARYKSAKTPLRFPGKVLADEKGSRLFIADSNHNRLVVAGLDGKLIEVIGTGAVGQADGDYATVQFNKPQGMFLHGDVLYVADTENHLLRKVDLKEKKASTIAGTGSQGENPWPGLDLRGRFGLGDLPERFVGPPKTTALNSPWAVWVHGEALYIAMAGPHQIWRMSLDGKEIGPYAGNGREDIVDGPLLPKRPYDLGFSSFAQPSGLTSDGTWLYVADSEGSAIRAVSLDDKNVVRTVVGPANLPHGASLFEFGDIDGVGRKARLQHVLGVTFHRGKLYVADTYNNKIKVIDLRKREITNLVGSGEAGDSDKTPSFDEPAGISAAGGKLYVADTNNHAIRVIDLDDGNKVSTLNIEGLKPPAPPKEAKSNKPNFFSPVEQKLDAVALRPVDGRIRLSVKLEVPEGYKLNPLAPMEYYVEASDETGPVDRKALGRAVSLQEPSKELTIELPVEGTGKDLLQVALGYYYCQEGAEGVCKPGSVVWSLPVEVSGEADQSSAALGHRLDEASRAEPDLPSVQETPGPK